ncbi:MnmC family methyltransferase [Helicobacter sp. 11S02596-1]|uniref:tRNA (5-methylaminomethyl-2-thiouridine)(34)-methyltransferase MnmD n=1 Tax=Helicobacter sp. 11S02596-1 TaxID=1476194 RepID=UPI000BA7ADFE|nr:MnmC family methyltransferase [Helicobacter sp. 11S02596-1]PAF44238.1 hypothetical protein BJI48_03385 [Helicobacter sp. 11S02596-1]
MEAVLKSRDGSLTFFNQEFGECYHSLKDGAYTETLHKHILPPILFANSLQKPCLKILDICFGLGYNTFTTAIEYRKMGYKGRIEIFSPEKDRGVFEKILALKYPCELLGLDIAKIIHTLQSTNNISGTSSASSVFITPHTSLELFIGDARDYFHQFSDGSMDIIYQDAFSPRVNPDLWDKEYFLELFRLSHSESIITTYSTNTEIFLNAKNAGFLVYKYNSKHTRKSTLFLKTPLAEHKDLSLWG